MNFSGELNIGAPRETVFDQLQDAPRFASLVDGVRELTEIDPRHYAAIFETKVAYMRFKFKVTVEVTRLERPHLIEAKIEGSPLGVVGRLVATSVTTLSEVPGGTRVNYTVEASIAGKLGSIGQPVLRSKAKEMEKQFARNLNALFEQQAGGVPT
jgi:carbon monoxide dehydrogenase subunit G